MERYDIIIIGTGPAGISATITAKIRNKNFLLIGSKNLSTKMSRAHQIQNYPGLPGISGQDFCQQLSDHLRQMEIPITEKKVIAVYAMGDYFNVQAETEILEADSVILATGVSFAKQLEGEAEYLGRGVSYCATCDAALYRGKDIIVIGYSTEAEKEANFLAEIVGSVTYFPLYKEVSDLSPSIRIEKDIPKQVFGTLKAGGVRSAEKEYPADGIFILRDTISGEQLVPGLQMENGHAVVNLQMETNLPGLFACGDIAGKPYQYIKAAGQGNVAALSAVSYLDAKMRQ